MRAETEGRMALTVVERLVARRSPPAPAAVVEEAVKPRGAPPALPSVLAATGVLLVGLLVQRLRRPKRAAEGGEAAGGADEVAAGAARTAARQPRKSQKARPGSLSSKASFIQVQWADAARPVLRLEVTSGAQAGSVYSVPPHLKELNVGRVAANDFVINDTEVSSQHARIGWDPDRQRWQLMDLGSLNGTRLNGQAVGKANRAKGEWHDLQAGDVVHFGERDESPAVSVVLLAPPTGADQGGAEAPQTPAKSNVAGGAAAAAALPPPYSALLPAPPHALRLHVAVREDAARGRPSEDRSLVECPLRGHPHCALFAVFDGHCGAGAAQQAAALLPGVLARELSALGAGWRSGGGDGAGAALAAAFLATDAQLRCQYEGCAATAVLVWRDDAASEAAERGAAHAGGAAAASTSGRSASHSSRLYVQAANVGDASATLALTCGDWLPGRGAAAAAAAAAAASPPSAAGTLAAHRALRLTEEHKVKSEGERARLRARGVALKPHETRLYGLALSRALGDQFLKEDAASGLTAEPFVSRVAAVDAREGAFAVLASDGLWDVANAQAAVQMAAAAGAGGAGGAAGCDAAAAALVAHARQKRSKDDVTVLVLGLEPARG